MKINPVGCKCTEFQPLVVGVVIANLDGRSEGWILCSMCIDIHIRFCSVFFFFQRRQSRFLSFAVGAFSVERRNRIIYCCSSNLGIRHEGNLGTCTRWKPEGCTRSEGAPVVKLSVSDISLFASVAPEGNISPVWLILSTFAYLHPYFCGPEHLLLLSDIHGLSAYLSGFFRCRIIIFLHFSGEVISDNRVVDTVFLSGIVHFEYWNQIDGFSFFTERQRIGITEFVFGCAVFLCPVFEGIILLNSISFIINALEEGIVGRDGKGADVIDGIWRYAYCILKILFLSFSINQ